MKKIALIIDVEDWAFANIARNIKEKLKNRYAIEIFPIVNYQNNIINILVACKEFDIIHFFWRGLLIDIDSQSYEYQLNEKNITLEEFKKEYLENKIITTCVQDHLFIDENLEYTKKIFSEVENYFVSSKKLFEIYHHLNLKNKPTMLIHDGVDLNKFYLKDKNKYKLENIKNRKIVIGWVGNSAWHAEKEDFKGFTTIIKPVIEELITEGYPIELKVADKQEKIIPHDEMPQYYSNIDILICASKMEGTPCPVIEAMACGNIIVSTDVGVVPEVFGEKQKSFILKNREQKELKDKLIYLLKNKGEFEKISNENQESVKKWDWNIVAKEYDEFFKNVILKREEKEIEICKNKMEEYEQENRKLKIILEATTKENQYMKRNIRNLNKKMSNIKNSKTWKIVRKIAKVKNIFRRKK